MQTILKSINPRSSEPILSQALKMALDDEFHAYEAYMSVIEKFGAQTPFTTIVEAEGRHQQALMNLFEKYNIEVIENRWIGTVEAPNSLHEAYLMGVNAEIENIQMYDKLLAYTGNYPDVQDVFYRLQAASYNSHLPAFQSHLEPVAQQVKPTLQNADATLAGLNEMSELIGKFSKGEMAPEDMIKIFSGTNASFIVGALVGALGAGVLSGVMKSKESNEAKEE